MKWLINYIPNPNVKWGKTDNWLYTQNISDPFSLIIYDLMSTDFSYSPTIKNWKVWVYYSINTEEKTHEFIIFHQILITIVLGHDFHSTNIDHWIIALCEMKSV